MARSKEGGHPEGKRPKPQRLRVIPEPGEGTRTILAPDHAPLIRGGGGVIDLSCGKCGTLLAVDMASRYQASNIVFKCPSCGSFNETGSPELN